MRLSCSHPVLLHRLAEPKASAMICNALYDILINCPLHKLYAAREDKDWSLTNCISFTVMCDEGLQAALTHDQHFEQAGHKALLR
jgi:hypothetical protein